MNKVVLIGRLTKDPEVKVTTNQAQFCNFTVAVDRRFKDANGQKQADFINCVAWRQTANFIGSYFHKGSKIVVCGSIQSRSYDDKNGQKRYVTEVVVDEAEFGESAASSNQSGERQAPSVAAAPVAPSAPKAPIAPSMEMESFDADDFDGGLPFEI